jgi:hypothetical protein
MIFDKMDSDSRSDVEFKSWRKRDVNPLGGTSKTRTLHAPNEKMRNLHRQFVRNLRELQVNLSSATSVPGSSPRQNVARHRYSRFFYLTDLSSAFQNVNKEKLAEVLAWLDKKVSKVEILEFLEGFCFVKEGGLITGSPSSPDLFNIYAAVLIDSRLRKYCEPHGITFSRYLDDLAFSSQSVIGARKRDKIREIVEFAGFQISHHKTRVLDLKKDRIEINGIGLEYGGRIYLPRWYLRKIRGLIRLIRETRDRKLLYKLDGMMGLFDASTDPDHPSNQIEKKVLQEYNSVRRLMGVVKYKAPYPYNAPPF